MLFEKFVAKTKSWWHEYFTEVTKAQSEGRLFTNGKLTLYPTMIIFTKFSKHYMAELVGASATYSELKVKIHTEKSIYRYLNQFDEQYKNPLLQLDSGLMGFRSLTISTNHQAQLLKERFPNIDLYKSHMAASFDADCLFGFGENFDYTCIENSILINKRENFYRVKNILAMYIVASRISTNQLEGLYNWTAEEGCVKGVHTVDNSDIVKTTVAQFQNMYLQPKLRETTLGDFINSHPEIIKLAFNASRFEYEPSLKWLEHDGTCDDTYINPDLIIENNYGEWDIYDLKTALLDKTRLTKDGRKRRRFVDYVSEGIAQLANYREYFSYERNKAHALEKYGIKITDPKMVLVVGSWENFDKSEVLQASRFLDKKIEIIDYDTFAQLIISGATALARSSTTP
ncbi:Shedu anti-phage system protein SduA domain-containing protein [Enterobacterales bacterium AW_CKDN230030176-1A_HGKHYDSX7]